MTKIVNHAGSAEAVEFVNEGKTSATDPFTLTGFGDGKGKYRIKATAANWNGGSTTFQTASGTAIATFNGQGATGHVDVALSAGSYNWSHTGAPQGLSLQVVAI